MLKFFPLLHYYTYQAEPFTADSSHYFKGSSFLLFTAQSNKSWILSFRLLLPLVRSFMAFSFCSLHLWVLFSDHFISFLFSVCFWFLWSKSLIAFFWFGTEIKSRGKQKSIWNARAEVNVQEFCDNRVTVSELQDSTCNDFWNQSFFPL